jgi:hypothetical protein
MYVFLSDNMCEVVHSPDQERAETKAWRERTILPAEGRATITVRLLRDPNGGWRTKSDGWYRTIEEVEADLIETYGRAVDADAYERKICALYGAPWANA